MLSRILPRWTISTARHIITGTCAQNRSATTTSLCRSSINPLFQTRNSSSSGSGTESEDGAQQLFSNGPMCDVIQGPNLLRTPLSRPNPSLMLLPGLRSLPWWTSPDHQKIAYSDPLVTHVVQNLESHVDTIREEYLKVSPTQSSDYLTSNDHGSNLHEGTWEWYTFLSKGNVQGHFAFNFQETGKILHNLRKEGLLFEGTPFGFCFFSKLHGKASIQAHTAPMNLRLRIHLPLMVPKNASELNPDTGLPLCGIRVGTEVREWIPGKALVLDDSYDHEVWNHTDEERVVLLVDIWHPDVAPVEKKEIMQLFQQARLDGLWKR